MKILLVDDDADIRLVGEIALAGDGRNTVRTVDGGGAALDAVRADVPDVVVTDAFMDDVDGPELLRRLRQDPATAGIPVVFLTARADPDSVAALEAQGAAGVLTKPFDPTRLLADLERILRH